MSGQFSDDLLAEAVTAFKSAGSKQAAADALGITRDSMRRRLTRAAERGMMGIDPVLPGYAIKSISSKTDDGAWIKQIKAPGDAYVTPDGQKLRAQSVLTDGEGRTLLTWHKTDRDREQQLVAMRAAVDALKEEIPRVSPTPAPVHSLSNLLSLYVITDAHLGALAWNEETGGGDYDLAIGERLIIDWFAAAIAAAPPARRGVFAQLGDFLHYDSFKSVTPEHGHLLDGDTRYPKMVRAAIRIVRTILMMLLQKHEVVDVVMSDANHDPSSEVWLREMFAAFLEHEPRIRVDTSPGSYSVLEHGLVSLYLHHGHRRSVDKVDTVFVGKFRQIYGRTRFSYGHVGHKHADELRTTNLMKVEQHETLAAPDAYAANGGWLSGRSAKVIHYHAAFGEVGRNTLTPEMVMGASGDLPLRMAA